MKPDQKKLAAILSKKGYKLTSQRKAVLDVVAGSSGHFTPAEVHRQVVEDHPGIGLVTVYRTLQTLAELHLICRVHCEGNEQSFTLAPFGHHHHMICSECAAVVDFTDCDLSALEEKLSRDTGFKIETHLLQFSGICRQCQGEGNGHV